MRKLGKKEEKRRTVKFELRSNFRQKERKREGKKGRRRKEKPAKNCQTSLQNHFFMQYCFSVIFSAF
jgi:hypothetical protein